MSEMKKELDDLNSTMTKGFAGVHARQDTTNGRINKLEQWQSFIRGGLTILSIMVVPILIYLISHWK